MSLSRQYMSICVAAAALVCFAATVAAAKVSPALGDDGVVALTHDTFDSWVGQRDLVLVEFYAPWCATCKLLEPEMGRAAGLIADAGLEVEMAKVNADADDELKTRFGIARTPTFLLFRRGQEAPERFPTYRSGEAIFSKLQLMLRPDVPASNPAKVFTQYSKLVRWLFWRGTDYGRLESTAVAFFPSDEVEGEGCGGAASEDGEQDAGECGDDADGRDVRAEAATRDAFGAVALNMLDSARFAEVRSNRVLNLFKMPNNTATIALYTDHDEGKHVYEGDMADSAAIQAFLVSRLVPMVVPVTHENLDYYSRKTPLLVHVFVSEEEFEDSNKKERCLGQLTKHARHMWEHGHLKRGEFTYALTNGEKYHEWMTAFGIPRGTPLPAVAVNVVSDKNRRVAPPNQDTLVFRGVAKAHEDDLEWALETEELADFIAGAALGLNLGLGGSAGEL